MLTSEGWITGTYNALNQPISITVTSTGVSTTLGYDPLGRCVKRSSSSVGALPTYLYYEGNQ